MQKVKQNNVEKSHVFGESDNSQDAIGDSFFSHFVINQANDHGQRDNSTIIHGISGKCESFKQFCDKAKVLAASLQRLGVLSGETVTIICENRLEYADVLLACIFTGTVFAPINPTYSPDEMVHILNIIQPCVIFCSGFAYKNVTLSFPRLKSVRHIVLFDSVSSVTPVISEIKYESLLENNPIRELHNTKNGEIAVILTSSGTTGLPKGVMLSYDNVKYFCSYFGETFNRKASQGRPVILGLVPLYHGYGYSLILSALLFGIKFILLPKFEEVLFLSTIEKYKITVLYTVPPLMVFLGKHPLVEKYDMSSVCEIVCGAAPLGPEVTAQLQARLPGVDIRQGYGMTETSVIATISPPNSSKPHSVGKLAPGIEAKVVDVETGQVVRRGEHGEIHLRGRCVMLGYCRDPDATSQTVDAEGWLHTGDVGYIDNDDYFYIMDRIKELIKYKGFQVAPAELESILLGMSGVKDAAVVGQPDLVAGELPVAFVVLQPNNFLIQADIISYVNSKVSPHKRLRGVKFVESIPKNPSGKILRRVLKTSFTSKL